MAIATNVRLGVTLEAAALEQYVRAIAAGCPLGVTSDFRDPDLQVQLFHENYTRDYDTSAKYDARKWGSVTYWRRHYNIRTGGKTVSVAVPGSSRHEKGLALDLPGDMNDAATPRGWMHAFGRPFGWYWPSWARQPATREEWHVEFDPTLVTAPTKEGLTMADTTEILGKLDDLATGSVTPPGSAVEILDDIGVTGVKTLSRQYTAPYAYAAMKVAQSALNVARQIRTLVQAQPDTDGIRQIIREEITAALAGTPTAELDVVDAPPALTRDDIKTAIREVLAEPYRATEQTTTEGA